MLAHRFTLPVASGILLALVFFPFYAWPLAFFSLAPLMYFAAQARPKKDIFWGGFITGFIGIGPTVFSSLLQIRVVEGNELFFYLVRASALPVLAGVACVFGAFALILAGTRLRSGPLNILGAAALYGLVETFFFFTFGGYYLGSLAYAAAGLPLAYLLASLGGAMLAAAAIGAFNSMCAEFALSITQRKKADYAGAALFAAVIAALYFGAKFGTTHSTPEAGVLPAAVIQLPHQTQADLPLGSYENGIFSDDAVAQRLAAAAQKSELVIYPYTPVRGATYDGAPASTRNPFASVPDKAVGEWLARAVPASTTVLLWNTAAVNGELVDQYAAWQGGEETTYEKRQLYALSDYAPAWLLPWGLHGHDYTIAAGKGDNRVAVGTLAVGSLICSELHQPGLARSEAARSPFIVAVGSDAMFPGDLMGNFSIAAARYRAAENGVPVVRGNINGPSAFINPDGSVQSRLGYGEEGVLYGALPLSKHETTPYARWGGAPVTILFLAVVSLLSVRRHRRKES